MNKNWELPLIYIFFLLLFFGIFLGDGKQSVIDVYSVSVVLVLWAIATMRGVFLTPPLPRLLFVPWMAFGVAVIVSTILSDSVGFSISWLARLACGYLVFRLFYAFSSVKTARQFIISGLVFVGVAGVLFIGSYMIPSLHVLFPSMNLISVVFGHSHFADLLVFVTPFVFWAVFRTKRPVSIRATTLLLFIVLLFLTLSRGAWLLVGAYSVYEGLVVNGWKKSWKYLVAGMLICSLFWFVASKGVVGKAVRPLNTSARLEYWRQALVGLKEKPIFGSGPGTFSLVSQRTQTSSGQSSWFVHSYPLGIAAETGVVGLLTFLWLVIAHGLYCARLGKLSDTENKIIKAIVWSVALVFLYSLFEFVLDYYVTWLLFLGAIGMVAGMVKSEQQRAITPGIDTRIVLWFIGVFYTLWVSSAFVMLTTKRYDTAYYLAPFDVSSAMAMLTLQDTKMTARYDIDLLLFFHRNNPVILFSLAGLYEKKMQRDLALQYYGLAVENEPTNKEYQLAYAKRYFENGNPKDLEKYTAQTCKYTTRTSTEYCTMKISDEDN